MEVVHSLECPLSEVALHWACVALIRLHSTVACILNRVMSRIITSFLLLMCSSQGWAPRIQPLSMCSVLLSVLLYVLGWGFRLFPFY